MTEKKIEMESPIIVGTTALNFVRFFSNTICSASTDSLSWLA